MGWRDRRNQRLLAKAVQEREDHINRMRTPLHLLDPLVRELVSIGGQRSFLSSARAKEIGKIFDQRGGMDAMRDAHAEVAYWHPDQSRALEMAWGGIGDWMG